MPRLHQGHLNVKKQPPPEKALPSSGAPETKPKDVVLVHGVTEDRKGLRVIRAREEKLEVGEVRPLVEGQPINSDVIRLKPRKESPLICDVETTFSSPTKGEEPAPRRQAGPARVTSNAYRANWDNIWAKGISGKGSSDLN